MKKVLFYIITIVMGIMLLVTSYQGFYMSKIQGIVETAIETKDFDTLARSFIPFFNKEEIDHDCTEGKYDIISYEAVIGDTIKVKYDDKEVDANRYEQAYVFFINEINFTIDGKKEGDKVNNYTSLSLYNGDKKYEYFFNDPIDATDPRAEGVNRYYTDAANSLKFVMISIPKKDIDSKLGGKITKLEVTNGIGEYVGSVSCDLDFDSTFFTDVNKIVTEYDKYLQNPNDKEVEKAYSEFYKTWYEDYMNHENYGIAFRKGEIKLTSVYLSTAGVMTAYLVICIVLGYFILRKKPSYVPTGRASNLYKPSKTTVTKTVTSNQGDVNKEKKDETLGETQPTLETKEVVEEVSKEEKVEEGENLPNEK